jgi:hypothetical protein
MVLVLLLAACGGDDPTVAPAATNTPQGDSTAPAATPTEEAMVSNSEFVALVERARASNHVVRAPLGFHSDEAIEGLEAAWLERFGFELILENEPGHPVRDMPTKITVAAEGGNGIIDSMLWGNAAISFPILEQGFMRKPNWEVVLQEWPELEALRLQSPDWTTSAGESMQDYCALAFHSAWVWNYNPRNVTAEEVANLTHADLLTDAWQGRVVADERALGFYYFPLAPGWDEARTAAFMNNLGANDLKIFPGGSRGVHQAILQGEGDIGLANGAWDLKQKGQPIDFAITEFTTGANPNVSCLPKFGVNDEDMAELFWAWDITEGRPAIAKAPINYGSAGFLTEEQHALAPYIDDIWGKGLRVDQLVYARTQEEAGKTGAYRQIAMDAQLEGIRTGTKVPYNY